MKNLKSFSNDVLDRFRNPYLKHALMSISLNSVSKFKTRVLPSLLEYVNRKVRIASKIELVSLAALIAFYSGNVGGKEISLNDDAAVLDFAKSTWSSNGDDYNAVASAFLGNADFWGQDLNSVDGLTDLIANNLKVIMTDGIKGLLA